MAMGCQVLETTSVEAVLHALKVGGDPFPEKGHDLIADVWTADRVKGHGHGPDRFCRLTF